MRVISFDPGGTTGIAMWVDGDIDTMEIGPEEHHAELWHILTTFEADVVICESFEFRQHNAERRNNINLISKEYIGIIKLWQMLALDAGTNVTLSMQTASTGKSFVSDDKLKIMGLWISGKKHARDALRHLVYWLVVKGGQRELVAPWQKL